ncbi:MAG: hypothetical protein ABSG74_08590 [Candidatus Bathyarchaeia archaeon]
MQSEIVWSLITIGYGIWKERHFVGFSTAVFNLAGFFMVLATVDLPDAFAIMLLFYALLGILVAHAKDYTLMNLLGSKPYGSLTLALGLYQAGFLTILQGLGSVHEWFGTEAGTIVVAWLIVALVSHIIMLRLVRKPKEHEIF